MADITGVWLYSSDAVTRRPYGYFNNSMIIRNLGLDFKIFHVNSKFGK